MSSRGVWDNKILTPRVLTRERDNRGERGGKEIRALIYKRLIIDIIFIELWIKAIGSGERASFENLL